MIYLFLFGGFLTIILADNFIKLHIFKQIYHCHFIYRIFLYEFSKSVYTFGREISPVNCRIKEWKLLRIDDWLVTIAHFIIFKYLIISLLLCHCLYCFRISDVDMWLECYLVGRKETKLWTWSWLYSNKPLYASGNGLFRIFVGHSL